MPTPCARAACWLQPVLSLLCAADLDNPIKIEVGTEQTGGGQMKGGRAQSSCHRSAEALLYLVHSMRMQ